MSMYPLKFKPRYVQKMWGGRKINTILGKPLPEGTIGESWEVYDFPPGVVDGSPDWISSEVAQGLLAGKTLHQLMGEFKRELLGGVKPYGPNGQFPLLIKFLDAREDLSVQVHPDEAYAKAHAGAHLKSEAWFVVQADPGSRLLKGVKPGVTRESFARAIASGRVESTIESIPARNGDCYYLPSGTVHALGAGILAAEVQTPSDTTFRVFDFNRIDPSTGKLRKLHVEEAMKCIDISAAAPVRSTGSELAKCEYFSIRKKTGNKGESVSVATGEPIILMFITGHGELVSSGIPAKFSRGDTFLIPASMRELSVKIRDDSVWLSVSLGERRD